MLPWTIMGMTTDATSIRADQTGAAQAPTDFRYWQASQEPKIRRIRAVAERVLGFDLCPPDEAMHQFIADMWAGDPVAERFVDDVFFGDGGPRKGRNMLDQALADGVDSLSDPPESESTPSARAWSSMLRPFRGPLSPKKTSSTKRSATGSPAHMSAMNWCIASSGGQRSKPSTRSATALIRRIFGS